MIRDNIRKNLDKFVKIISILCLVALLFAAYVSIQHARKRTKGEIQKKETYFNTVHQHFDTRWAENTYWNDHVETSRYRASGMIDSTTGNINYTYVLKKRKFNDELTVETSDEKRPDVFEVMDLSCFGATKSKHWMNNMYFLRMNTMVLHKMTYSFEDNEEGSLFKSYKNNQSVIKLNFNSYHDKEGVGEKVFDKDVLFEDQLCYTLRSLKFKEGLKFQANVLETQISSSVGMFKTYPAEIEVSDAPDVMGHNCWKVLVSKGKGGSVEYYFEKTFPNEFVKQVSSDGRTLELLVELE